MVDTPKAECLSQNNGGRHKSP